MPYRIPTMAEVRAVPWNGYNVVSTFSGAGGSCLGYRMAGYAVVWASEFVPAAQDTYRANHPDTFLNTQDLRDVTPEQVVEESGLALGEIDILDGSPPCASFSTAGKRERFWGKEKQYSDTVAKVDDLFFEYTRLLRGLQPRTFVAENVGGLVKGAAKGYFKQVLREMRAAGYEVSARLLNAMWLGVPQSRERLIFVGVRKDLCERYGVHPAHPRPRGSVVTLGEAIADVRQDEEQRAWLLDKYDGSAIGRELDKLPTDPDWPVSSDRYFNLTRESLRAPCSTITQLGGTAAGPSHPTECRKFTIPELKRITGVPDDFILTGKYERQWERLGRMVPPPMMLAVAETIRDEILVKMGVAQDG